MRSENSTYGRQRRSFIEEARRAQIVSAAAETVAEYGYANASLARIAERAEVSKSVISYHFDGKDELLTQVVTQFFDETWEYMQRRINAAETSTGKVRAWVGAQLEYFDRHRSRFLAMSDIVMNHREADGSHSFSEAENEEVAGLAEILRSGQRDGEVRDFTPETIATIIIRCTEGLLGPWAMDDGVDLTASTDALLDFIDHAIRMEGR